MAETNAVRRGATRIQVVIAHLETDGTCNRAGGAIMAAGEASDGWWIPRRAYSRTGA